MTGDARPAGVCEKHPPIQKPVGNYSIIAESIVKRINGGEVIGTCDPTHLSRIILVTVADGVAVALFGEEKLAVDCKLLIA